MNYYATLKQMGEKDFRKFLGMGSKWVNLTKMESDALQKRVEEIEVHLWNFKKEMDELDDDDCSRTAYAFIDVYYDYRGEYTSLKAELEVRRFPALLSLRAMSEERARKSREYRRN